MKVVYVCALDVSAENGALNHVIGIAKGLALEGVDVTLVARCDRKDATVDCGVPTVVVDTSGDSMAQKLRKVSAAAVETVKDVQPDCIYLRNYSFDYPLFIRHVSQIPIFLEINAVLHSEYAARNKTVRAIINSFFQKRSVRSVAAWLPTTSQIQSYCNQVATRPRPSMIAKNGIWTEDYPLTNSRKPIRESVGTPENNFVMAMAGFDRPWHGWDFVVECLPHMDAQSELWLIGCSSNRLESEVLAHAASYGVESRVKVFPWMNKNQLAETVSASDLGLGALALHRKNATEIQALKVGMYLALGIPSVINCPDPRIATDSPFVRLIQTTDPSVFAEGIVGYARSMSQSPDEFRAFADENLNWQAIASELKAFIGEVLSTREASSQSEFVQPGYSLAR